jgi:uncharacterized protein (DUF736 family)
MSRKIGSLWQRKTKDGKTYLSCILEDLSGDIRIAVFKNDRKEKENQPDYQIVLSGEKKETTQTKKDDFFGEETAIQEGGTQLNEQPEEELDITNIPF